MARQTRNDFFRLIDANFNRAKEGLRVCEDICRFLYNETVLTRQYKEIRHRLTKVFSSGQYSYKEFVKTRDSVRDVGRPSSLSESRRKNAGDIYYANSQRIKESIRVLEEFAKLYDRKAAEEFKKLRYQVYALEKKTALKF